MEVRKVFKAGNSFAVSIPADWVREMHLEEQPVEVARNEQGEIVIRPITSSVSDVTPKFYEAVDRFVTEYGDVLKGLADR
ncbi:AbrB/MazE/SpoVT family DNA-binding domain-containing protein [Alicyclobacillus mengziensis]|uniref:AbrB/MazE/SpoVT family DNA-binding domain-containing protein n=1 Tax=Alicyclobacillus mengziensis TaxID=2931921 RepID=A0A9X7Z6G9_9BACL|nr:AbrB/MazE/SpoVT family DNA-binding domain-containing protein [Alicyclobacillus mengziensis]QSO47372.1 AbrB/MazE/SpoVT family DNA-binding domain-containing protein [Alicyclobacillus mengziensis]